ncbi:hypothetical protein BX600DRAFT_270681 [Xylariales sp. PMI_506]|nr:hypothetical protein BX600DRAFT_270681 [Xylariales sp. PMI_506]
MPQRDSPASGPQWPPRSPHEVLMGTPGGRERLRRMADRTSPSPSPLKKTRTTSMLTARSGNVGGSFDGDDDVDLDDDDDDEETLQLKLQAIQAKLKLKALQKKQKAGAPGRSLDAENATGSRSSSAAVLAASRAQSRAAMLAEAPKIRPQSQNDIQVPVSPTKRIQPSEQNQRSPSRVLLGIDKGLKAKDVSLKRVSSLRKPSEGRDVQATGGYLRRAHTPALGGQAAPTAAQEKPRSFSERLAAARTEEIDRKDRRERIKQARSLAFAIDQEQNERYKQQAIEIPDRPAEAETFSREQILAGNGIRRSNTAPSVRKGADSDLTTRLSADSDSLTRSASTRKGTDGPSTEQSDTDTSSFEPFSNVHLSKRILPHTLLTRTFAGKKTYLVKDLLAEVKGPDFQLPEIEQDIIVMGILASKSEPKSHKPPENASAREVKGRFDEDEDKRGKYMVLTLVDLQWELELFLFDSAFQRYWKLMPGTLVAILNPAVMPPPKGREHTNRFSLVLNSDEDSVLEIGTARDLGFCKSVKKNGEICNSWVNKKRTEFCEFHMNLALDKRRLARQDLNANGSIVGGPNQKHKERWTGWKKNRDAEEGRGGGTYDRYTNTHYFMNKGSAASLLDGEQFPGQVAERLERSEALKRKLKTQEKEREIMRQLGKSGRGAGREYMQRSKLTSGELSIGESTPLPSGPTATEGQPKPPDARSLGLLVPRGSNAKIHLSPIKRKRDNSTTSNAASISGPLGWGGSLKDKLARMKEGEKLSGAKSGARDSGKETTKADLQPALKKTRFVTEKGIREAGRESLGLDLGKGGGLDASRDDSEDELEILM